MYLCLGQEGAKPSKPCWSDCRLDQQQAPWTGALQMDLPNTSSGLLPWLFKCIALLGHHKTTNLNSLDSYWQIKKGSTICIEWTMSIHFLWYPLVIEWYWSPLRNWKLHNSHSSSTPKSYPPTACHRMKLKHHLKSTNFNQQRQMNCVIVDGKCSPLHLGFFFLNDGCESFTWDE